MRPDPFYTPLDNASSSEETENPKYTPPNSSDGYLKAEDVVLPDGYTVESVTVEKETGHGWVEKDGHLKVFRGDRKISNDGSPPQERDFDVLTISMIDSTAHPLGIEIVLTGVRPNGTLFDKDFSKTFADGTPLTDVVQAIGTYAESIGMTVAYPDPQTVVVYPEGSGLHVLTWWFTAFEDNDVNPTDFSISYFAEGE